MTGEPFQSAIRAGLPPMAVPMTVKMPEPMTMPMPSAVSETGPSVLRSECSGRWDWAISLSIDFVAKSWDLVAKICLGSVALLEGEVKGRPAKQGVAKKRRSGLLNRARSALGVGLALALAA
jgi:hypothetical protein